MAKMTFTPTSVSVKAIGVGGGGSNAVNRMVEADIQGSRIYSGKDRRPGPDDE